MDLSFWSSPERRLGASIYSKVRLLSRKSRKCVNYITYLSNGITHSSLIIWIFVTVITVKITYYGAAHQLPHCTDLGQ